MIALSEIELKLKQKINISYIEVIDLRGGDHIQVIVVSSEFENKSLIEQHKIVYDVLSEEIKTNQIHALTLKTYSPNQWEEVKVSFKRRVEHEI